MQIQRDILEKAGVSQKDIRRLERAWDTYQAVNSQPVRSVPHIVCTGIYNAGKSTLLNALAGKDIFPTGDIPTTKALSQAEFGGAVYVDTPGLNAEEADDQTTRNAYETADFILFVSNAQNGGISAAEAEWLNGLRQRYTAESLQQRLIYVLSHSAQVEPEELSGIQEHVQNDLEQAIEFAPEQIFCVDSILYQQGREQSEPLLVENSGISVLQGYLAERIADADRVLTEARTSEIAARRQELLTQIGYCKDHCLKQTAKLLAQGHQKDVGPLFAKATEELNAICKGTVFIGDTYVYMSPDTTRIRRMGVTSPFSAEADAKKELNSYYERCMSAAESKLDECVRFVEKTYCTAGMESTYFKSCSAVNGILEKLTLELRKLGFSVDEPDEIRMDPDSSSLAFTVQRMQKARARVEFYDGTGLFNTCYDVFGNRFTISDIEEGHYKRTLFGEKWVTDVGTEIEMGSAMQGALDQIRTQMSRFEKSVTDYITYILSPFLNKLKTEADKRLEKMHKAVDASIASAREASEMPLRTALNHLSALEKEVSA